MEERCPKCGEPLITKTIKKELGLGSIDYPVARVCPKCNWNIDLTGAKDIKPPAMPVIEGVKKVEVKPPEVAKPPVVPAPPRAQPKVQPAAGTGGFNKLLTIGLAILVIGGLIWAFSSNSAAPKQSTPTSTLSPTPTPAPAVTATATTPIVTSTQVPEVTLTPTGKKIAIKLDSSRGFFSLIQGTVKIQPGDEVVFTNEGTYAITLVSAENLFEPEFLNNDKRMNYTFYKTGTYGFYLKENKNLNGTIVVEP
jgi:plastocyanin